MCAQAGLGQTRTCEAGNDIICGFRPVDAGNIYTESLPRLDKMRFGAGLGGRYYSSFGPIRIDIGTPINRRTGEARVTVFVSLGQAF